MDSFFRRGRKEWRFHTRLPLAHDFKTVYKLKTREEDELDLRSKTVDSVGVWSSENKWSLDPILKNMVQVGKVPTFKGVRPSDREIEDAARKLGRYVSNVATQTELDLRKKLDANVKQVNKDMARDEGKLHPSVRSAIEYVFLTPRPTTQGSSEASFLKEALIFCEGSVCTYTQNDAMTIHNLISNMEREARLGNGNDTDHFLSPATVRAILRLLFFCKDAEEESLGKGVPLSFTTASGFGFTTYTTGFYVPMGEEEGRTPVGSEFWKQCALTLKQFSGDPSYQIASLLALFKNLIKWMEVEVALLNKKISHLFKESPFSMDAELVGASDSILFRRSD